MIVAEFLGTATLTAAVYAMAIRTSFPFFSAAAGGLTVGLMILIIGAVSEAHINPAITVGLWTLRKIDTAKAVVYIAAQLLGAIAAWRLIEYLTNTPLKNIAGKNIDWRVMVAEGLGALILGWGFAYAMHKAVDNSQKATIVGAAFFIGVLVAAFASNGLINPAVAVGIRSWNVSYIVAPLVGSVVGMNLYTMLFADTASATARVTTARTATKTTTRKKR